MVANWGTNLRYQPTNPRKDRTSFLVLGRGQFRTASTLSTCGRTSPLPSWYPSYLVCCRALTLARVQGQSGLLELSKDQGQMLDVLLPGVTEDHYIVQVSCTAMLTTFGELDP